MTVAVLAGIAVFLLISNLDGLVKRGVETVGTQVIGAPVRLGAAQIDLREGSGKLTGFTVANPSGFPAGNALELGSIELDLDLQNVSRELVGITRIAVDGAKVNAIQNEQGNNLQALINNIRQRQGQSESAKPGNEGAPEPLLMIDEFRFENSALSVTVPALDAPVTGRLPAVVVRNIGTAEKGVTPAVAARQILDPVMREAVRSATSLSGEMLREAAEQEAKKLIDEGKEKALKKLGDFLNR